MKIKPPPQSIFYCLIAVIVFGLIVAGLGRSVISYVLLSTFAGIIIIFAAHLIAIWFANIAHYGVGKMFLYRRMLRPFHNSTNNTTMNTILWFWLFAAFLLILSVFFFYAIFITIPIVLLVGAAWLRAGVPPFVLVLGNTGSKSFRLSRRIMAAVSPHTVAELLDNGAVDESTKDRMQYELGQSSRAILPIDSFFPSARIVVGDDSWQEAVTRYCLVARVIVFDFTKRSAHTEFEIQTINTHRLWYKVMILGDGNCWLYDQPWYKTDVVGTAKIIPSHDDGLLVINFLDQVISGSVTVSPETPIARVRLAD